MIDLMMSLNSSFIQLTSSFIMTSVTIDFPRNVAIDMLRKGNNGNEILQILNVIVPDQDDAPNEGTLEPIEF